MIAKLRIFDFLKYSLLVSPILVNAAPLVVSKQIQLTAEIPTNTVDGNNLLIYPLDGDFKRLDYNVNTKQFNDIWFYVRGESSGDIYPNGYRFIQTYNTLSCYGGSESDVVEMSVKINDKPLLSGSVVLNNEDLWYRGADKYFSDVAVILSSPIIEDDVNKWCTGQVSFVVASLID
ncbi:hypothetical protein [Vibrio harveyi]|uniref:hypothetical protein n=1 Tax=Vibrio harveyi TaxID=669 RepID=UPI003CF78A18